MSADDAIDPDDKVMEMIRKAAEESAGQEQAQSRQLSAAEEAMMAKMMKGKSTKQQKLIEQAFKNTDLLSQLQKLEQEKAEAEMLAKMKRKKKKKDDEGGELDYLNQALKVLDTVSEQKDEALADGKIKNEADAKRVEAQALQSALSEEQKVNSGFMKLIQQLQTAQASADAPPTRELSAPEEAQLTKLKLKKPAQHGKWIERAFYSEPTFFDNVQTLLKSQGDIGKKKKDKTAAAASAPASAGGNEEQMMEQALKAMESIEAGGAAAAPLTEEQKNNEQFMTMLKQMTEAEANVEVANARQMSASESAMLAKLQKGKSTKQQKLIEKAFQDQTFVENMQKAASKKQEDDLAAKLALGKKKKNKGADDEAGPASAAQTEKKPAEKKPQSKLKLATSQAADSLAQLDAVVTGLILVEEARSKGAVSAGVLSELANKAASECLNDEQRSNAAFMDTFNSILQYSSTRVDGEARELSLDEEILRRKLQYKKDASQKALIEKLFNDAEIVEKLTPIEEKRTEDQSLVKLLQQKAAKKKELALHQAAADSAARLDAVVTALTYIEEMREAAANEGRGLTVEEITLAQTRAADEALTVDQKANAEFMALFAKLVQEAAARDLAQKRSFNAAEEELLRKLANGKTTDQTRLINQFFHDLSLADNLRILEEQKAADAMAAKLLQAKNRKKREATAAEEDAAQTFFETGEEVQVATEVSEEEKKLEAEAAASVPASAPVEATPAVAEDSDKVMEMMRRAAEESAGQEQAQTRQQSAADDAMMAKLMKGKTNKQQKLIEAALKESGLVQAAQSAAAKKQEEELAARLAAGKSRKKKVESVPEEKYPEAAAVTSPAAPVEEVKEAPVVDYLEAKYGEMLAEEQEKAATEKAAAVLENQGAIAQATQLGMSAGADGVEVAEIAAHAAALGLTPEQITAAATAAAAVSNLDDGAKDHANFMDLFRKATEDSAAEQMRRKQAQSSQDADFLRKLAGGRKTKQQLMVEKQMADILAAQERAKSFQTGQDEEMQRRLLAGKKKKGGLPQPPGGAVDDAKLAAEALASEMLISGDTHDKSSLSAVEQAKVEIEQLKNAPTILDELLAISDAQQEEISRQAAQTGISEADIIEANKEALELDNMAAQLMLEKAREAEAAGDMESAAAFMELYRKMVEEGMQRDSAVKRQLTDAEDALMRKLMKGKTTKQQKMIEAAFQNQALVNALMNQEQARQQALMEAKLRAGKAKKEDEAQVKAADEAFARLRKIFLGAIKKLDANNIIRQLDDVKSLIDGGFLDLNKPIKESGETMLHQASKYGRVEVIEWLLKQANARPNVANAAGQSPVHFAAISLDPNGADKIVPDIAATSCMLLIEGGGDVNQTDLQFETPLSIAARFGFDLNNLANTPEAMAALARQKQIDAAIRSQMEMNQEVMSNDVMTEESSKEALAAQIAADTAAKLAAQLSQEDSAASTSQVQIDPATGLPMTSQQLQMQKEELENLMNEEKLEIIAAPTGPLNDPKKVKAANMVFIQLCDLFRDINNPRNESEAAALIKANVELIKEGYLDLSKPMKNKQDGSTLLHTAVFHQKLAMVRQLLQNRADPNKITMTGETPLHIACGMADREPHGKAIVSLLLEAGANPQLRDFKNGHTPFEMAPNAPLRKWMEEWKPLAERQRLALANQMGGLEDMLNKNAKNLKSAADSAENELLKKLMRGKITKQQKLIDEALKNGDAVTARMLQDQLRQLEAMEAKMLRGKKKKGGLIGEDTASASTNMTKEQTVAAKKKAMLDEMLLAELSDATQDKLMLTADKWNDHPLGISGLDTNVLQKLRGMPIADALKMLATQISECEQSQLQLNQAINAPGLDEQQAIEYERQFNIADCNADIYKDLTTNMLEAEKKRQDAIKAQSGLMMSEEDVAIQRAKERLEAIEKKAAAKKALKGNLPAAMMEKICQIFSDYIALNTGYEVEPALIMQGALPMEDLQAYQLDVETIQTMLAATDVEAAKGFITHQSTVNEAVQQNLQRHLADENLSSQQREEAEILAKLQSSNAIMYEQLMGVLLGDSSVVPMQSENADLASQAESEAVAKREPRLAHPDTGLAVNLKIEQVLLEQMRELCAEFLGMDPREMNDLSPEQLQQALAKAGVNVDILDELRKLTEAEAGKWLAKEMAKNEAESEMLRKLLNGKGLSEKKRAELLARRKQLDDAADLYNDLLSTLLTGEKKRYAHMSAEEQLAQDRMLQKLAARRRKQELQELAERKKRQQEEIALAQQAEMERMEKEKGPAKLVPVVDENGDPVLASDGTQQMEMIFEKTQEHAMEATADDILAKQNIMHQLIADNPTALEGLNTLAAEHLGIAADEFKKMSQDEVQMLLVEKGVDFNLLDYLKTLTSEEAAKQLARDMARAEAEAKMIRKLLMGKNLTPEQREELLAKQRMLEDNAKMYEDMLRDLLSGEQKKYSNMTKEEKAAYDAMQQKLALRKAREVAKAKEFQIDEGSELLDLFDHLASKGPYECRVCQTLNEAVNRNCKFCKKSRADTLALDDVVLLHAHRHVHQCSCPNSVIEVIARSMGPCTKKNFLPIMQATVIACDRDSNVFWDTAGVDFDNLGCIPNNPSELVWGFNDWDIENPKYHVFRDKHLDSTCESYLGWNDFRDEVVQPPTLTDYQLE